MTVFTSGAIHVLIYSSFIMIPSLALAGVGLPLIAIFLWF
jgi:hypothetical protein